MPPDRHHRLQRSSGAAHAAGQVDDEGAIAHAGNRGGEHSHWRAGHACPPHRLTKARYLIGKQRGERLRGHVAWAQAGAASRDDEVDTTRDRGKDRLRDPPSLIGYDFRCADLEPTATQHVDERGAALVFSLAVEHAVADGDAVGSVHFVFLAGGRCQVTARPPGLSSSRTDSMNTPRSMPLVMSMRVRPATAAAGRASISTPVWPTTRARASTRTPPAANSKSTSTLASRSGWHSGISSEVRLAAMMPAT